MDLAKIRKKSALTRDQAEEVCVTKPVSAGVPLLPDGDAPTTATAAVGEISFISPQEPVRSELVPSLIITPAVFQLPPACSPLEILLAGRKAAGCDEESVFTDKADSSVFTEEKLEFLCFRVYNETYCLNIMDIKEIIKPREVTEVPRSPAFLSGVLSLRGTIIPVIDMRIRLGLAQAQATGKERVVVVRTANNLSGLLVDEVIQVVQVSHDSIEPSPAVLDGIDRDFVSGIGRAGQRLMIILNLENIININMY